MSSLPLAADLKKVPVGSWAEYRSADGQSSVSIRIALVSLLLAFFVLGSILGVLFAGRSMSTFSFGAWQSSRILGRCSSWVTRRRSSSSWAGVSC